jgi:uncharacterized protein
LLLRFIYLHGFASGPSSRKARVFASRLEAAGASVSVPALDGGDFARLTITGQYEILRREAAGGPVTLVGSSMGGYLAALYASLHPAEVEKLVLLAPAFHFHTRWPQFLGDEKFRAWRETGKLSVFHYAAQEQREVGWQLAEDAAKWDPEPDFRQPALIFHGTNDDVVPVGFSERFAASHANVKLRVFDAGHELTEALDEMWTATAEFLSLPNAAGG